MRSSGSPSEAEAAPAQRWTPAAAARLSCRLTDNSNDELATPVRSLFPMPSAVLARPSGPEAGRVAGRDAIEALLRTPPPRRRSLLDPARAGQPLTPETSAERRWFETEHADLERPEWMAKRKGRPPVVFSDEELRRVRGGRDARRPEPFEQYRNRPWREIGRCPPRDPVDLNESSLQSEPVRIDMTPKRVKTPAKTSKPNPAKEAKLPEQNEEHFNRVSSPKKAVNSPKKAVKRTKALVGQTRKKPRQKTDQLASNLRVKEMLEAHNQKVRATRLQKQAANQLGDKGDGDRANVLKRPSVTGKHQSLGQRKSSRVAATDKENEEPTQSKLNQPKERHEPKRKLPVKLVKNATEKRGRPADEDQELNQMLEEHNKRVRKSGRLMR